MSLLLQLGQQLADEHHLAAAGDHGLLHAPLLKQGPGGGRGRKGGGRVRGRVVRARWSGSRFTVETR